MRPSCRAGKLNLPTTSDTPEGLTTLRQRGANDGVSTVSCAPRTPRPNNQTTPSSICPPLAQHGQSSGVSLVVAGLSCPALQDGRIRYRSARRGWRVRNHRWSESRVLPPHAYRLLRASGNIVRIPCRCFAGGDYLVRGMLHEFPKLTTQPCIPGFAFARNLRPQTQPHCLAARVHSEEPYPNKVSDVTDSLDLGRKPCSASGGGINSVDDKINKR